MQRFLPVGDSRFSVLSGIAHLPRHAQAVSASLGQLAPDLVLTDRSRGEWRHRTALDGLEEVLWPHLGPGLEKGALWNAVHAYCQNSGARLGLLHEQSPPAPKGKNGTGGLQRILKREGFEATADPMDNLERLYEHYIPRCPALWEWVETRRDRTAARLCAAFAKRRERALVVIPAPHADEVCERVKAMLA